MQDGWSDKSASCSGRQDINQPAAAELCLGAGARGRASRSLPHGEVIPDLFLTGPGPGPVLPGGRFGQGTGLHRWDWAGLVSEWGEGEQVELTSPVRGPPIGRPLGRMAPYGGINQAAKLSCKTQFPSSHASQSEAGQIASLSRASMWPSS